MRVADGGGFAFLVHPGLTGVGVDSLRAFVKRTKYTCHNSLDHLKMLPS